MKACTAVDRHNILRNMRRQAANIIETGEEANHALRWALSLERPCGAGQRPWSTACQAGSRVTTFLR